MCKFWFTGAADGMFSLFLGEETDRSIRSRGENPGLGGVKGHVQNTQVLSDAVSLQDFNWNDQRILQQVAVNERRTYLGYYYRLCPTVW